MSRPSTSSFPTVLRGVANELAKMSLFKRNTKSRRLELFAMDLVLVAFAVRTGYLIDVVAPNEPVKIYSNLLQSLRQLFSVFENVFHVYEPSSEQSFFVNARLFDLRYKTLSTSPSAENLYQPTAFILLDDPPTLLPRPPSDLLEVLEYLNAESMDTTSLSISLKPPTPLGSISISVTVPLAAFLLEYPVAYVPSTMSDASTPFLANIPLDVYECIIANNFPHSGSDSPSKRLQQSRAHSLLKYSCPHSLGIAYPAILSPHRICALLGRFEDVLASEEMGLALLKVQHTVETLGRVAL